MLVAVDGFLALALSGFRWWCPGHPDSRRKQAREAFWLDKQHRLVTSVHPRLARALLERKTYHVGSPGAADEVRALCERGQLDRALDVLSGMDRECCSPSVETYVTLLKACEKSRAAVQARRVCAHLARHGLESNRVLGETVVITLVKCGALEEAVQVFHRLPHPSVFCWTAVISGYSDAGRSREAINMYHCMREEGLEPDKYTLVSVLKACSISLDLDEGKRIHAEAFTYQYECDVFVGTSLVNMYGKCGSVADAWRVFDGLSQRNVVSWNAMLAAYASKGQAEKVLELYEQMLQEGASSDVRTFVSSIQACGMLAEKEDATVLDGQLVRVKALGLGKALHADSQRKVCDSSVFVGSTLITMYGECGCLGDAQRVFDALPLRNTVTWNAMLAAYVQLCKPEKAAVLYQQMLENGVSPDSHTFVAVLQACGTLVQEEQQLTTNSPLGMGKVIHAHAWRKGYKSHVFVGNTLISMYGKCRSIVDAQAVFDGLLPRADVVSWNAMLVALTSQGEETKALELYERMQQEGVRPDDRTLVSALQACGMAADREDYAPDGQPVKLKSLKLGQAIHAEAWKTSYRADVFISNTLVWMYGKCGSIADAQHVFDGLAQRNAVSWNVILSAYLQQGQAGEVLQLYKQMQRECIAPDEVTLLCILQACSSAGSLDMCHDIHQSILVSTHCNNLSQLLASTLIHAYGRCASMGEAQTIFDTLSCQDIVAWNTLIAGYARQGDWETTVLRYQDMLVAGLKPDRVTFLSLLSVCSHAGLVDMGIEYLESMGRDHGLAPHMEHYVSVVDLLGRAGCFSKVEDMLLTMPMEPNLSVWLCLLGACRKHNKVELGKRAFDHAVQLQPKQAAPYVLMSNIYAQAGMVDRATEVNNLRQKAGAWKNPGESWIRHVHQVHTFVVGDDKHPKNERLVDLLVKLDFTAQA